METVVGKVLITGRMAESMSVSGKIVGEMERERLFGTPGKSTSVNGKMGLSTAKEHTYGRMAANM